MPFDLPPPDSGYVNLVARRLPNPLRPDDLVILEGYTTNAISIAIWEPADTSGCHDCLLYYIQPHDPTWVKLTVYDENGCPGFDSLLLVPEPQVYAPNVINTASTSGNDRFLLYTELPSPVHELHIFDRWGNQVFERRDFMTNSPTDGWDGFHRGEPVGSGEYTYWAKVEVTPGVEVLQNGNFAVFHNQIFGLIVRVLKSVHSWFG